jgi:hypothetical protein
MLDRDFIPDAPRDPPRTPPARGEPIKPTAYNGVPVPVVDGTARVAPRVAYMVGPFGYATVWKQNASGTWEEKSNGHTANVVLAVSEAPIAEISAIFRDGRRFTPSQWQYLVAKSTTYSAVTSATPPALSTITSGEAVGMGFQGTAYFAAAQLTVNDDGTLPEITFEVKGRCLNAGGVHADPASVVLDLLTDPRFGLGLPAAMIEVDKGIDEQTASSYRTYCAAMGFGVSRIVSDQEDAAELLANLLLCTNSEAVWTNGKLVIVPWGDTTAGAYVPPTTSTTLDADEFIKDGSADPITVQTRGDSEVFNHWPIRIENSAAEWNDGEYETGDSAHAAEYGLRRASAVDAKWLTDPAMAKRLSSLLAQRSIHSRNVFKFRLKPKWAALDPMDYVTLNEPTSHVSNVLCRIVSIKPGKGEDASREVEAIETPLGTATPVDLTPQAHDGHNAVTIIPADYQSGIDGAQAAAQTAQASADAAQDDVDAANVVITQLETDLAGLDTDLTTASGEIDALQGSLSTLSTSLATANGEIDALQTSVGTLSTNLATANGELATLETDLGTLNTNLTNKADKTFANVASGAIAGAKLADGAITLTKFGTGLRPVQVVASLPVLPSTTYPQGATVVLTTDNKLYRSTGSAWTASVPTVDISGQITSTQITDDAVTTAKIAANAITATEIAAGAVVAGKLAANAVTANEIAAGAIVTGKIAANAVTANEIAADAVTADKVAANAIVAENIAAGAVTTEKMTANTINGDRILANTLSAAKIIAGSITTDRMTANSIGGDRITAGTLDAAKIVAGSITTDRMTANSISGDRITANTLDAAKIVAGSITTDRMTANSINGDRITASTLNASKITAGTITADRIAAGQIKTSNYAEDVNGKPTVGAKLDHQGTALKVAPDNLQIGGQVMGQTFFNSLNCLDGSQTAGYVFIKGNDDPSVRGGAPDIWRLYIANRTNFSYDGSIDYQTTQWDARVVPTNAVLPGTDNIDTLSFLRVKLFTATTASTPLDTIYVPIRGRGYRQNGSALDNAARATITWSWRGPRYEFATSPFQANLYLRCALINAYGVSAELDFQPSAAVLGTDLARAQYYVTGSAGGSSAGGGGVGGGGACPAPWVPLDMADGTRREAGDVQVGDLVRTRPEDGAEYGAYPVAAVSKESNDLWAVSVGQEGKLGMLTLQFAYNHRFDVVGKGWVELQHLVPGDVIVGKLPSTVVSTEHLGMAEVVRITIQDAQTYETMGMRSHNVKAV